MPPPNACPPFPAVLMRSGMAEQYVSLFEAGGAVEHQTCSAILILHNFMASGGEERGRGEVVCVIVSVCRLGCRVRGRPVAAAALH